MANFTNQIQLIGQSAKDAIEHFMSEKSEFWVNGYIHDPEADPHEINILNTYPEFFTEDGDLNTLLGFQWLDGEILIHALLQIRRQPIELYEYSLDNLEVAQLCTIADSLESLID